MVEKASAQPQKRLFLELLTRDITLEDAVLDLIDNSLNSVIAARGIDLQQDFDAVIAGNYDLSGFEDFQINIQFDEGEFSLTDNCGGIAYEAAKNHVFEFGKAGAPAETDTLSVYGIGLKRALFKLGNKVAVSSNQDVPFAVAFLASAWAVKSTWTVPLRVIPADRISQGTTCIRVSQLFDDTRQRLKSSDFDASLRRRIRETYCFFINRFCRISVNGADIDAEPIMVGSEDTLQPAVQRVEESGITAIVIAGLAPRRDDRWIAAEAGWYIFCNGRAVIFADRTRLTGWEKGLPQFVSKFRGFRGIVFFFAKNPELLPWTTTKTDINEESVVFQRTLNVMYATARPVLTFLNTLYSADEIDSVPAKAAAEAVISAPLTRVVSLQASAFHAPARRVPTNVTVQFTVKISDVDRIRQHLKNPGLSARKIAETAFRYYLENEVG